MAKPSMDLSTFVDKRLEGQDGGVLPEGVRVPEKKASVFMDSMDRWSQLGFKLTSARR